VNSKTANRCNKILVATFSIFGLTLAMPASAWEVDFSRRQTDFNRVSNQSRLPASVQTSEPVGILDQVVDTGGPAQDIVIMNTEKGFVPDTVYLKKGGNYRLHIVNVNDKEKNISFVLDAFSEHHNTLFGQQKSFTVTPKADGIFTYQCPETAIQGKLVIVPDGRKPASH
jgi:plastocyanin